MPQPALLVMPGKEEENLFAGSAGIIPGDEQNDP